MASNRIKSQGLWLDAAVTSMDVTTLFLPGQLGQIYEKNGKAYQIVQFKSTTATIAAGTVVMWVDHANFIVSAKVSDIWRNAVAGVALLANTAGNYGFIQVRGSNLTVVSTGSITAGDLVVMSATDGTAAGVAAGTASTYIPLGICSVTAASNVVGVDLTVPLNGD